MRPRRASRRDFASPRVSRRRAFRRGITIGSPGSDPCDYAWDLYQDVLKLSDASARRNERDVAKALPDGVPSAERLCAIAASDNWFSLAEFIEVYCDPIQPVELDSEKVWPVQQFERITGYLNDDEGNPITEV